jgi:hypothetical protein
MFVLPVAAFGCHQSPTIRFDEFEYVSNFHDLLNLTTAAMTDVRTGMAEAAPVSLTSSVLRTCLRPCSNTSLPYVKVYHTA